MTLTKEGMDYCLRSFGNANECAVSDQYGLTFSYTDTKGQSYSNIPGGTGSIVNFLALGIVVSLTMDQFPGRGTFTKELLETANGASVSLGDGNIFTKHDERSGDQWCGEAQPPPEIPWVPIIAGITIVAAVAGVVVWRLKK